ncbi:hypothetical protein [Burkholderia stabilis]
MTTTPNEKSPAPELASEAADSGAHPARESIVDARAAAGNETSSKVGREDALTIEQRATEVLSRMPRAAQARTSPENVADVLRTLAASLPSQPAAAPIEPDVNQLLEAAALGLERAGMLDSMRIVRGMKPGYPKQPAPAPADERAAFEAWYRREFSTSYPGRDMDRVLECTENDPYNPWRRYWVGWQARAASANETVAEEADEPYLVMLDVRDLFAYLRAAWREGQHYDREDMPDQADSWSAASDYANKTIERWTSMRPVAARSPAMAAEGAAYHDGIEAVAKMIDEKAVDYAVEFGCWERDTGALSFGQGAHADVKRDYHSSLVELAEEVRAMAAAAPQPAQADARVGLTIPDTTRALLLNVLWHHQGDSSEIGQPIRKILGIGEHDHLTGDQLTEAKRIERLVANEPMEDVIQRENDRLRADLKRRTDIEQGHCWYWIGDGCDKLESLTCQVIIKAADLRALLAAHPGQPEPNYLRDTGRTIEEVCGLPEPRDAIARSKRILMLVDEYHENPTSDTRTALRVALMDEFQPEPRAEVTEQGDAE